MLSQLLIVSGHIRKAEVVKSVLSQHHLVHEEEQKCHVHEKWREDTNRNC